MSTQRNLKSLKPTTKLFTNNFDQSQFIDLYSAIFSSQLSNSLQIQRVIIKEIAEFATGQFVNCANPNCTNQISILVEDKTIYDNDHANAQKVHYKWCIVSGKKWCNQCMDLASTKFCYCQQEVNNDWDPCCDRLTFKPDCGTYNCCSEYFCNCKCGCSECISYKGKECYYCEFKTCLECDEIWQCKDCKTNICPYCVHKNLARKMDDYTVFCNHCLDNAIIKTELEVADFRNIIEIQRIPRSKIKSTNLQAVCAFDKHIFTINVENINVRHMFRGRIINTNQLMCKCRIYDPAQNQFGVVNINYPYRKKIEFHTSFNVLKLKNDKLLICQYAKRDFSYSKTKFLFIYDVRKNRWQRLRTPECYIGNCCISGNGDIHMIDKTVHFKYSFENLKWSKLKNIQWKLEDNGGFVLGPDDCLYYFGGIDWSCDYLHPSNAMFIYKNGEWIKGKNMLRPLDGFGYCHTGSQIVVIGSNEIYIYNFASSEWYKKTDQRFDVSSRRNAVVYCNNQIYCLGWRNCILTTSNWIWKNN
eukprot:418755_1